MSRSLSPYSTSIDAFQFALDTQQYFINRNGSLDPDKHINIRIGVHVGDVIVQDNDVIGHNVNIAARIHPFGGNNQRAPLLLRA